MTLSRTQELLAVDRDRVWHPYASMPAAQPPLPIASASGVRLRPVESVAGAEELIDGNVVVVGRHPRLPAPRARRRGP